MINVCALHKNRVPLILNTVTVYSSRQMKTLPDEMHFTAAFLGCFSCAVVCIAVLIRFLSEA